MTALFPARRSAEEFAHAIDGTAPDRVAERYAGLTSTVDLLERQEQPKMRADFAVELRARLMLAADEHLVPSSVEDRLRLPVRTGRTHERRLAAAVAALVLVGGTAGVAAAAQGTTRGDALYPLKRGIERAQIELSTSKSSRGADYLSQASARMKELKTLVGQGNTSAIDSTLSDYTSSAAHGSDLLFTSYQAGSNSADITKVHAFTAQGIADLENLRAKAPAGSIPSFADAADMLAGIDQQADTLCAACGGGPLAVPDNLLSLTSPSTFDELVNQPAAPLPTIAVPSGVDPNLGQAAAEAAKAAAVAAEFPPPSTSTSTSKPGTPGATTLPASGTPVAQSLNTLVGAITSGGNQVLAPVTSTLTKTTDALDQATGGLTTPLSQTLNNTLNGLLGGNKAP